ncbi:ankyrin repeat protein, partial [Peniophora sp. CONT]
DDTDKNGEAPLHWAAYNGYPDAVRVLLEYPAIGKGPSEVSVHRCQSRGRYGWTALHNAAYQGHVEVSRLLLSYGATIDDTDDNGDTPLQLAEREGHLDVVRILVEYG